MENHDFAGRLLHLFECSRSVFADGLGNAIIRIVGETDVPPIR